jgi:hypothetical protein
MCHGLQSKHLPIVSWNASRPQINPNTFFSMLAGLEPPQSLTIWPNGTTGNVTAHALFDFTALL